MNQARIDRLNNLGASPERQQPQLAELVRSITELAEQKGRELEGYPGRFLEATREEAWQQQYSGSLRVNFESDYIPDAILELTYYERHLNHSDEHAQTEQVYCFVRNNDGDIMLQVSNTINREHHNDTIQALKDFDAQADQYASQEVHDTAKEPLLWAEYTANTLASAEVSLSLRLATEAEVQDLQKLIRIADAGDLHSTWDEVEAARENWEYDQEALNWRKEQQAYEADQEAWAEDEAAWQDFETTMAEYDPKDDAITEQDRALGREILRRADQADSTNQQ